MYTNSEYLMIECLNKVTFFASIEYGIWFFTFPGFLSKGNPKNHYKKKIKQTAMLLEEFHGCPI